MTSFRVRINSTARSSAPLVVAADIISPRPAPRILGLISDIHEHVCAIKLNMHALLPLGATDIRKITSRAHKYDIQVIADIKLNDIPATNDATLGILESVGVDAVIVNPVMGAQSLGLVTRAAHRKSLGIIALAHMSAPEARHMYETRLHAKNTRLYHTFVKNASDARVDGLVVGATFPKIVAECAHAAPRTPIYSPGIGVQGGDIERARDAGTKYFIVGRSIINARNPKTVAARMHELVAKHT